MRLLRFTLLLATLSVVGCPPPDDDDSAGDDDDSAGGDDDSAAACAVDLDGDGVTACGPDGLSGTVDDDCDDGVAAIFPGAAEVCDGLDDDCDSVVPATETDDDGDTFDECADGDCDDSDATVYIGAAEVCDGVDNDCDGVLFPGEGDVDDDTYLACDDDCDDGDATVYAGAPELCDGLDNNCDSVVPAAETADADDDGITACPDCDDGDATIYPGATELCDGLDNDCDTVVPTTETDTDGDGALDCDDCDDGDPTIHAGAAELCDGLDNNCDSIVPPAETTDADGDGVLECADCDDSSTTAPCEDLLSWAEVIAAAVRTREPVDDLRTLIATASSGSCPGSSTATGAAVPAYVSPQYVPGPYPNHASSETTLSGGCSDGGWSWTGTAVDGEFTSEEGDGIGGRFYYGADWLEGAPAGVSGPSSLSMDGGLYSVESSYLPPYCQLWDSWSQSRVADAIVTIGPGSWTPPPLLGPGVNVIDFHWVTGRSNAPCDPRDYYSSLNGTVEWYAETTPWTFDAALTWSWSPGGPISWPVGETRPPSGCAIEPSEGSLTLTSTSTPTGPPDTTVEVVFNGSTACDGCGDITVDGVASGTWCPASGFGY